MKQIFSLVITLLSYFGVNAQFNPSRTDHYIVPCDTTVTTNDCNLIPNGRFRHLGDSLEAFSDGKVPGWQDINSGTSDINGALGVIAGWNPPPSLPGNLATTSCASMLVDNYRKQTEGIAAKVSKIEKNKKYGLSFFLSSSQLSGYRTFGGNYNFKVFITHCQNFGVSSATNPEIDGDKQLVFCESFRGVGNTEWQQYFLTFTAQSDFDMVVIYPELPFIGPDTSLVAQDSGTYVHFLYPEIVEVNPTYQHFTNGLPPDSITGITVLSACGIINATYKWFGPNGLISESVSDVIDYDQSIGDSAQYLFTMRVDGAMGNNPGNCVFEQSKEIKSPVIKLPTLERVDCAHPIVASNRCNLIPNATFSKSIPNSPNQDAFRQNRVGFWGSVNGGTPDLNGGNSSGLTPPLFPSTVPATANAAGMFIETDAGGYGYEGIYAKIPQLVAGRTYAFSFFLNTINDNPFFGTTGADFVFNATLSYCQEFPITPLGVGYNIPPNLPSRQTIFCQHFPQVSTRRWQQYLVTFTANAAYDMIVIYPEGNVTNLIEINYVHFLMPELIDVTDLVTVTQTSACNYILQGCGVTNANYQWVDGNSNTIGNTSQIIVNEATNPPPYSLTLSVANILDNPILNNNCSNNTETITGIGVGRITTWTGATSNDWNQTTNWNPPIIPDNFFTNVLIPAATNEPVISSGSSFQVLNLTIPTGGSKLINNGILKVASSISAPSAKIDNYLSGQVTGSIEMNGTCIPQTLGGNVFVGNDVKNFTAGNDVTLSSATGQGLDVSGELSFGTATGRTLITGGNLTLVSIANSTANVAKINATNFIFGNVTVERYINTGTGTAAHTKKWQALATPTGAPLASPIGQSIYNSWMEGGNNSSTGYGTHIPDPTGTANGFDAVSFIPSIKTNNAATGAFVPIPNTSIPLYNKNGYFLFVRGDRAVTDIITDPNPTILRSKGGLFQPYSGYAPPIVTLLGGNPTGKYELVGNPYASAIDVQYMKDNGYFTNLTNNVTVWDPLLPGTQGLGGYQTLSAATGYKPTPGGTALYNAAVAYPEIQSGQAFFMQTIGNGLEGSVSFNEAIKISSNRLVTRSNAVLNQKSFHSELYSSRGICDGNTIIFNDSFSSEIDADDAGKLLNPGENFMIKKGENTFLSVEARSSIVGTDSIFYSFSNLRKSTYQLRFASENLNADGISAVLVDLYLKHKTVVNLSKSEIINFIVDDNEASYGNRFILIFVKQINTAKKLPFIFDKKNDKTCKTSFEVYPNPVENKMIHICFKNSGEEKYNLQLLNGIGQLVYTTNLKGNGKNSRTIKFGDLALGNYRLIITGKNGKKEVKQLLVK